MTEIREYKIEYNYWIDRYNKAEKYFKSATIEECTRRKILDAFNEVVRNLSRLLEIFRSYGIELTDEQKFKGFSEVRHDWIT